MGAGDQEKMPSISFPGIAFFVNFFFWRGKFNDVSIQIQLHIFVCSNLQSMHIRTNFYICLFLVVSFNILLHTYRSQICY